MKRSLCLGLSVVFAAAVFAGCGMKIGQRPDDQVAMKLGSTTDCLNGAGRTLGDYFRGGTTDREISDLFSCSSKAFELFQNRTRGARPDEYSMNELRKFLQDYFLSGFTVSDKLLNEVKLLKQTLVGGSADTVTTEELRRLRGIMDMLRDQSIRLRPYLPLTPENMKKLSPQDLATAISALKDAAAAVGQVLEENAAPYSFAHLNQLLFELESFVQDDDQANAIAGFRNYVPLFRQLKQIFVSPDATQIVGSDWRVMLTTVAEFYSVFLRYAYIMDTQPTLISGPGREQLAAVTDQLAFPLLVRVVGRNPMGTVSYCNLNSVIDELSKLYGHSQDLRVLAQTDFADYPVNLRAFVDPNIKRPADIATEDPNDYLVYFEYGSYRIYRGTLKKFILPLVQTLLKPQNDRDGMIAVRNGKNFGPSQYTRACSQELYDSGRNIKFSQLGLVKENIDRARKLFDNISEGQNFLQKTFEWAGRATGNTGLSTSVSPEALMSWTTLNDLFGGAPFTGGGDLVKTLSDLISHHRPMFIRDDMQMEFNGANEEKHDFVGLSWLNAIRQVIRLAWTGYTNPNDFYQDPITGQKTAEVWDSVTGGVLENKIEDFYADTREIGIAIKLYDPSGTSVAKKRFLEGNLLTYASDGNAFLSVAEGTDLISFLLSSKILSGKTYKILYDRCAQWYEGCPAGFSASKDGKPVSCHIGPLDSFGQEKISTSCLYHFAFDPKQSVPEIWDHMLDLKRYYGSLPSLSGERFDSNKVYRETFRCLLEQVARPDGADPVWYDSGDIDQMSALYHYLEGLFVRFDVNHQQALDQDGARAAYPVLKFQLKTKISSITTKAGLGPDFFGGDRDIQAILDFLLAEGRVPDGDLKSLKTWTAIADIAYRRYLHSSNYKADRARIMQVMGMIIGTDTNVCFLPPDQRDAVLRKKYEKHRLGSNQN